MKRQTFLSLSFAAASGLWCASASRAADFADEFFAPIERPLMVRLFAGQSLDEVAISGTGLHMRGGDRQESGHSAVFAAARQSVTLDNQTWPAPAQFIQVSADAPLTVSAKTATQTITRQYAGEFRIQWLDGRLVVVNLVPVEDYVCSVLDAEASPSWSFEALRAQAIAIRTFGIVAASTKSTRSWDLNDDTSSQVYRGLQGVTPVFQRATDSTRQQVVTRKLAPAAVFYSATCGGHTASLAELGNQETAEHLNGIADVDPSGHAYCAAAPYFRWRNAISNASLARVVERAPATVVSCSVTERWPSGRVKSLAVSSSDGSQLALSGRAFYTRCLQVLGYKVLPSTFFEVRQDGSDFMFTGHGIGHGLGLCQWGARGRADAGFKAEEILQAYFPGTEVRTIASF